ncbi:MAG: DUF6505 family protein [Hyphomicrobiaceae bacterium]|jgi:hypothetical protein
MALKLLRTIRLDASDTFVFERAAEPGEWAVSGGFMFWGADPRTLAGREKQAFRAGFLGIGTFGWSTLAVVVEATEAEREAAVAALAARLVADHGAPSLEAGLAAAAEEIAFSAELAQHPVQTLVALHRTVTADGNVSEQFRTFRAAEAKAAVAMPCSAGAFAMVPDDGDETAVASDEVDLAALVAANTTGRAP